LGPISCEERPLIQAGPALTLRFCRPRSGQRRNIRQIPAQIWCSKAVAHGVALIEQKPKIVGLKGYSPGGRLVQQGYQLHRSRPLAGDRPDQEVASLPRLHQGLHDEHMLAGNGEFRAEKYLGGRNRPGDFFDLRAYEAANYRDLKVSHQVRGEDEAILKDADQRQLLSGIILGDLARQLLDPSLNLLCRDQDFGICEGGLQRSLLFRKVCPVRLFGFLMTLQDLSTALRLLVALVPERR
jgi:hypothetical protein